MRAVARAAAPLAGKSSDGGRGGRTWHGLRPRLACHRQMWTLRCVTCRRRSRTACYDSSLAAPELDRWSTGSKWGPWALWLMRCWLVPRSWWRCSRPDVAPLPCLMRPPHLYRLVGGPPPPWLVGCPSPPPPWSVGGLVCAERLPRWAGPSSPGLLRGWWVGAKWMAFMRCGWVYKPHWTGIVALVVIFPACDCLPSVLCALS